ncbi:MAG: hypothetical protein ACO2PN_20030 [Pyrobaculum sp.]
MEAGKVLHLPQSAPRGGSVSQHTPLGVFRISTAAKTLGICICAPRIARFFTMGRL